MVVLGYNVGPLLKKTGREVLDDGVPALAAQTAYYFFFSLFPLFLFLSPLLALVGDRERMIDWVMGQLATTLPADAVGLMQRVVGDVVFAPNAPGLMSVGLLLAAWSGSNIFGALIDALNRAYDVEERRPWLRRQLLRLASLVVAGAVLLTATVVMLAGERITQWLGATLGLGPATTTLWTAVQYPLAIAFLIGLAWLLFYFLPNVRQRKSHVLAGAVLTTLLWLLVTLAFRFYVQNFASYNKTYGTIGGVIVLLTWMYLSMLVVLVGGEFASELHHGTGRVVPERAKLYGGQIATGAAPARPSTSRVERVQPMTARGPE